LASLAIEPRRLNLGPVFITFPIFGLLGFGFLSIVFSSVPYLSLYHSFRLFFLTLLYLYLINERPSLNLLVIPLSIMVVSQSTVGVAQVLNQASIGLTKLGELLLDPNLSGISIVFERGIRSLRAYGLTDHPNILGGCLTFSMLLIASWYATNSHAWKQLIIGVIALGGMALLLTYSRSAWLAFILGGMIALVLLFYSRQKDSVLQWILLILASGLVLLPLIWHNFELLGIRFNLNRSFSGVPQEEQSIGERFLLNQAANEIFVQHPLTGVGLGTFPFALKNIRPEFPVDYQPAHFVLLDVASETGIFAAVVYAFLSIAPWVALWINRHRIRFTPYLIASSSLLLAVIAVGWFDYYPWLLAPGRIWQWMAWGFWAVAYQSSRIESDHD
jgi:O-antigen ligase